MNINTTIYNIRFGAELNNRNYNIYKTDMFSALCGY